MDSKYIRNFCIISHIDHGKSTLADRFLETTKTIEPRKMREQFLDTMEIERERGITIKMQPVRMTYTLNAIPYTMNLIDTPGHIDFSYEVSRALAAVEGAILLVDATQGVQAQTIATMDLARGQGLVVIPAINKIDSPNARQEEVAEELKELFGFTEEEIFYVSARTGDGVEKLLDVVVQKVPIPIVGQENILQALIFDSQVVAHRGAAFHIRIISGQLKSGDEITFLNQRKSAKILEVGVFAPELKPQDVLGAGEIGYVFSTYKSNITVGETIAHHADAQKDVVKALPGYSPPMPVVFANIFTFVDKDFDDLKKSLETLSITDPSFTFEETSSRIARGFRCGFAGSLHMEIILDRLGREHGIDVVVGAPTVAFKIIDENKKERILHDPAEFPTEGKVDVREQWARVEIFVPNIFLSAVVKLIQEYEGEVVDTQSLGTLSSSHSRLRVVTDIPARRFVQGFFDALKSVTAGHGSLFWKLSEFRSAELGRLDVLVAGKRIDAFARVVPKTKAQQYARSLIDFLYSIFPKELFVVKLQAEFGGRIIASRTISAARKDVTGHLYGGDRSRKMKLWQKQKKGKKKLLSHADITIRPEVFKKALSFKG